MSNHTALYFWQILHWDKWFLTLETHSRVRHCCVVGTIAGWLPYGWDIRLQRSVGHSGVIGRSLGQKFNRISFSGGGMVHG